MHNMHLNQRRVRHPLAPTAASEEVLGPTRAVRSRQPTDDAEPTWRTMLETAARHWHAGEYVPSIRLQAEALKQAETLQKVWPQLWSALQLGMSWALIGETASASALLQRTIQTAVAHGQPVIAGLCVTLEGLCLNLGASPTAGRTHQQLCDVHRGLVQYLHINQLPLAHVCWAMDIAPHADPQGVIAIDDSDKADLPPDIEVNSLGRFDILIDGRPLRNLPTRRSGILLKYLLVNYGQMIPFDVLLEQFWPDTDPDLGRNRLHQAIHCLRSALAADPVTAPLQIVCNERRYGLASGLRVWSDTAAFERFIALGRQAEQDKQIGVAIAAYEKALALYQGDFLPEDRYVDWTQAIRMRLHDLYLDTFDRLSLLFLSNGEPQNTLTYCRQLLAHDRCREDIHQRMMHCYAMLGQRTQALRQYELCTRALRSELDLEPLPETTELYLQIKGESEPSPAISESQPHGSYLPAIQFGQEARRSL